MEHAENEACLLGIDVGTTALKTALYDIDGRQLSLASQEYPIHHPRPGWAEHFPELWWKASKETINTALSKAGVSPENIACVSVSCLSPVLLPVDKDGEPLRPAIIWMDTRGGTPHEMLPKLLWIRENEPEILKKTHKILLANGYINHKLTGQFSADISQSWWQATREKLADELDKFPSVYGCSEVIGEVTTEAARETGLAQGTPVVAGASDGLCAILGASAVREGRAVEFTGQSCVVVICTDKPCPKAQEGGLWVGPHVIPGKWLVAGGMSSGGGLLKWFRDALGQLEVESAKRVGLSPYQIMDLEASKISPGSDGLIILPYIAAERCPIWNANARGVVFGLYLTHTRAHIVRAILEAVAYGLRHNVEIAEGAGAKIEELRATGGGSKSRVWLQIKANVLGKPIYLVGAEAEPLGDAILAGVGAGVYKDIVSACERLVKVEEVIKPNLEEHEHYTKLYKIYREIYEQLKGSFDKLAEVM